jgi:hypothetical protein
MDQLPTKRQSRARETLFRVAYQHQGQLIQIADYKANMIISICTMIISAIIAIIGYGVVTGKGDDYIPVFILPVLCIIISCLVSLIYAIQGARPKFVSENEATGSRSSLMFFGMIARHTQQEYIAKMNTLLEDEDAVFENMTIDLYNQGIVLKIKYELLRKAYNFLLIGFVLTVMMFIGSLLYSQVF